MKVLIFILILTSLSLSQTIRYFEVDITNPTSPQNSDIRKIMFYIQSQADSLIPDTLDFVKFDSLAVTAPVQPTYKLKVKDITNNFTYHFFYCKAIDHNGNSSPVSDQVLIVAQFPDRPGLRIIEVVDGDTLVLIFKE